MNKTAVTQEAKTASFLPPVQGLLQRKCACGNHTVAGGECAECAKNKSGLQRKLSIGVSNDPLEREADRVADQVMAAPANSAVSSAPLRIQRYSGQVSEGADTAPASVDRVLASSGRPMESTLRQGMEQRFGHDFSQVRVHTGGAAEQSARDVNANAYTVGHNIVFGAGQFVSGTQEGRLLIAHELTHVVQQKGISSSVQTKKKSQPAYVEGGGATPGKGDGIDVVFIINSPGDAFTDDVVKYIQNTLKGQDYYIVDGLDELFNQLNTIATGIEYHYVPIVDEMKLPPEMERLRDIRVPPRKVRRIRLVAHGQTVIGGVSMRPQGKTEKQFIPPSEIVTYSKQPRIQKIVQNVMTPDAVVEFWGCNIGAVPEAGEAWSNLFQSKFKAIGDTFKTGFDKFYRRPDKGETGEIIDGIVGEVVQVLNSSEVNNRGKRLKLSFDAWLLKRYAEFVTNGDILPVKGQREQLLLMKSLFDKSNGDLKYIQIDRKIDNKLIRPGDAKEWKKLWVEFSPVKIGTNP